MIMRHFALLMALVATVASNAEEIMDTTIVSDGHSYSISNGDTTKVTNVTSIELKLGRDRTVQKSNSNGVTIETEYSDGWSITESFNFPFANGLLKRDSKKKSSRNRYFNGSLGGFYVGFTNVINVNDAKYDGNMARSVELGFVSLTGEHAFRDNLGLNFGLGFNWRNYKIDDNYWMQKREGYVTVEHMPEGYELKYSNLRVFSLQTPVTLEYHPFSSKFHLMLGVVGDFRVGRRIVNRYYDDLDRAHKNTVKHVRTLPVGCDLMAQIGHEDLAFYVKYSPVSLFENSSRGPIDKALTVGVKLVW